MKEPTLTLHTLDQAADRLVLERHAIRELIASGELRATLMGCHVRVPEVALREYEAVRALRSVRRAAELSPAVA